MRKTSLIALSAIALCACEKDDASGTTAEDYEIVKAEVGKKSAPGVAKYPIIKIGLLGDVLIPVEATPQLKAIYQNKKTAKFWSITLDEKSREQYNARNPYVKTKTEYCLINIMFADDMAKNGWEGNSCDTRLVCAPVDDIDYNEFYAVELCRDQ
jgi:hypothetical protein